MQNQLQMKWDVQELTNALRMSEVKVEDYLTDG